MISAAVKLLHYSQSRSRTNDCSNRSRLCLSSCTRRVGPSPSHGEGEHVPFITLGLVILVFLGQAEAGDPAALAERLMAEEGEFHPEAWRPEFLWDVTCFDSCHASWQSLVRAHLPDRPLSDEAVLVRDELWKPMRSREELRSRRRRQRERGEDVEPRES